MLIVNKTFWTVFYKDSMLNFFICVVDCMNFMKEILVNKSIYFKFTSLKESTQTKNDIQMPIDKGNLAKTKL